MAANTLTTLNGNTKRIYGRLKSAVPKTGPFLKLVPWDKGNKVGDSYEDLVILASENGVTYCGTAGGATTLLSPTAMTTAPARITPAEFYVRPQITYAAAARAAEQGPKAFAKAITLVTKNALESLAKRLEISCLYGQSAKGIGQVAAAAIVDATATTHWLVFAEDQWAPRIWAGSEGAYLEAYTANGDTVISSSGDSTMTVTQVDFANRKVLVTAAAGVITAVETDNDSYATNIYFKGSRSNDMLGLEYFAQNTSASVFGISATTYGNWKGNLFTVSSEALTHAHVMGYVQQIQARADVEDMVLLCSKPTWADLHQEQASTRVYDESYTKAMAENGFEAIRYHTSEGTITVVGSGYVKGGEAFLFPKDDTLKRIGSEEGEWSLPGSRGDDPWFPVADTTSAEMRIRNDQALFCNNMAAVAKITGITNTFGSAG